MTSNQFSKRRDEIEALLEQAKDLMDGFMEDCRSWLDERSDKWLESEKGQQREEQVEAVESVDIESVLDEVRSLAWGDQ